MQTDDEGADRPLLGQWAVRTDREALVEYARRLLLEAMFDVGRWDAALDAVADACGARTGQLIALNGDNDVVGHVVTRVPDGFSQMLEDWGFANPVANPRFRAGLTAPLMTPVADQDYACREERKRSPSYAEIYEPHDLPFNCQVVLMRDEDAFVRASVTRTRKQGPLDEEAFRAFHALMPHMLAAMRVQLSLSAERCATTLRTADAIDATAFLISDSGRVIGASRGGEALAVSGEVLQVTGGRLRLRARSDQSAFDAALLQVLRAARDGRCVAPAPINLSTDSLVLDVQPLPRERVCFGGSPAALVVVRAVKFGECAAALRRAHGLTRAEADVALALADGQGLDAIAAHRGVAIATVRSQVQSVYAKMDVHRQAELAAAVRRLSGR